MSNNNQEQLFAATRRLRPIRPSPIANNRVANQQLWSQSSIAGRPPVESNFSQKKKECNERNTKKSMFS
jgi:hypothetical protein